MPDFKPAASVHGAADPDRDVFAAGREMGADVGSAGDGEIDGDVGVDTDSDIRGGIGGDISGGIGSDTDSDVARDDIARDEIARDLRAVDWAATPLGPVDGWPQSLRTAVGVVLSSRFPMWMAWGPELTFFCNAAYRRDTLGRKYPWALGRPSREVWAEAWAEAGPRIQQVLATGRATWDEGLLLFLERSGYVEETYHTFSYSPLGDDAGRTVGMLCVVIEETNRVIGDRRMATLRDLGSDPRSIRTDAEVVDFASAQLDRNRRDLPFTLTYLFDDRGGARLVGRSGFDGASDAAPPVLRLDDPAALWPAGDAVAAGFTVMDVGGERYSGLPSGAWDDRPRQAAVVPLQQPGTEPRGFLVAGLNPYRQWDEGYRGFVTLVAGHIAAGLSAADSYQLQARRAEGLAELDRAKTAFFTNVSHEFRTPLTLILGPVQDLLAAQGRTPGGITGGNTGGITGDALATLQGVERNAVRLSKLVTALLDFSRLEAGGMQANRVPVDLSALTSDAAGMFRSAIERAGLSLSVECAALSAPVRVDVDMWEKIVFNLLSNALKFTLAGSIDVRMREEPGAAVLSVADTGIGVSEAEMPRLFERFHRADGGQARSHEGSGIGLAMVRELVGLHGGSISAESAVGVGTTFTVRLPLGAPSGPPPIERPLVREGGATAYVQEALTWLPSGDDGSHAGHTAESDTASSPGAAHVLIADDNADMRAYLTRIMRAAGYRTTAVGDGQAALDRMDAQLPDLVISDVMMPRLDGLDLVRALRTDPRTAVVPVLLLSARAGQEASIEGLRVGADDYLIKPFTAAELLARSRSAIRLARLRSHHARWRTALVDALQEAFFVCDERGAVVEINAAFTDILGYGTEGLPYRPIYPWWPDPVADPDAHRAVTLAFAGLLREPHGSYTVPVTHRDGHRLWISASFNEAEDPDTGRRVIVGTFRDVTAEHYAIQRETAVAAMATALGRATDPAQALASGLAALRLIWHAERAVAVRLAEPDRPAVAAADPPTVWSALPEGVRRDILRLQERPALVPVAGAAGVGIVIDHVDGPLAIWIDAGGRRPLAGEDRLLLTLLAGHLAQGLSRAHQFDQQRETALALQRAMLGPALLPDGFAVRYEPATPPLEVGGDWYDTIPLGDGRIGVVVGDCVGRGLAAAAVMGQLRSACRALLLNDASPRRALQALDRFAVEVPGALCSTVFCAVLDTETGLLVYSSAGHPPGVLSLPDGTVALLEDGHSIPLGVRPGRDRPEAERTVPAGATLLLYTDGLVERRKKSVYAGIHRAGRILRGERSLRLDELADYLMTRLAPAGGFDDDVALLLYRHPAPLDLTFPADAEQLAPARQALRAWLHRCVLPAEIVQDVLTATGEACTNAIEHGCRDHPAGTVRLRAETTGHALHVLVSDTGRWKPTRPDPRSNRGRGIAMMRAMMHAVDINHDDTGTTVEMQIRTAPCPPQ